MKKSLIIGYLGLSLISVFARAGGGGISTSGLCKISVPRDRISISFTAVQQSQSSKEANGASLKKYESFRKGVGDLKLKNFEAQTTDMSLSPKIEWVIGKNVNKGYEARASLLVTTSSMERVSELYDLAAKVGTKRRKV